MKRLADRVRSTRKSLSRRVRRLTGTEKPHPPFLDSRRYWESRYGRGGTSGSGSRGQLAAFKASVINAFVEEHSIRTVIEFGCGDGNQLRLASYPSYVGFDVSDTALTVCRTLFAGDDSHRFLHMDAYKGETADLTLSLDVIYHLVEDRVFDEYMRRLFDASTRYVIIYSSNADHDQTGEDQHVRHRHFSQWIAENAEGWTMMRHIPNPFSHSLKHEHRTTGTPGSFADFFIYEKARA